MTTKTWEPRITTPCTWCQRDLAPEDMLFIPDSHIVVCEACLQRYEGVPDSDPSPESEEPS